MPQSPLTVNTNSQWSLQLSILKYSTELDDVNAPDCTCHDRVRNMITIM